MAVLMVLEWPGQSLDAYERVNEIMGIHGDADAPEGLIDHVATEDEGGLVICDVWQSEEALNRFVESQLGAAVKEAGIPDAKPRILKVHNRLVGKSNDAGVLILIDIPDFGPAAYDQMTKHMDAHVMNEHPSVGHTAALGESGGMVVADIWNSPEAFGQFAQEQIGPAAEQVGLGEFEPRILPVRNRIRGKVTQSA